MWGYQFLLVAPHNTRSCVTRRKKHQIRTTYWPTGPSCLNPLAISIRLWNLLLWVKWGGCKSYTSLCDSGKNNRIQTKDLHSIPFKNALCNPQQFFFSLFLYHIMKLTWERARAASEPVQCTSTTVEDRAAQVCTREGFICCGLVWL